MVPSLCLTISLFLTLIFADFLKEKELPNPLELSDTARDMLSIPDKPTKYVQSYVQSQHTANSYQPLAAPMTSSVLDVN